MSYILQPLQVSDGQDVRLSLMLAGPQIDVLGTGKLSDPGLEVKMIGSKLIRLKGSVCQVVSGVLFWAWGSILNYGQ